MTKTSGLSHDNRVFTLVELMIAISVLAVVLLIVSVGIIQLSKTYYKGVTQANTQQKAREIMDNLTQTLQFGNYIAFTKAGPLLVGGFSTSSYCIDTQRFTFADAVQKQEAVASNAGGTTPHIRHGLWLDDAPVGGCTVLDISVPHPTGSTNGHELLGEKMRITNFSISSSAPCSSDLACVDVGVMYGDDDLIDKTRGAAPLWECQPSQGIFSAAFCGKAALHSIINRRLAGT